MTWDLKNKVVVITGGAAGIGYEIANKYLYKGAKTIIILDNNEKLGVEAVEKLTTTHGANKAVFLKCDVAADIEAVSKEIFSSYTVDVLVNSAGIANDSWPKKTIDINLAGLIECSLKFWEHMRTDKSGKGGTIINIASIYGLQTDQFLPIYQASKFGVVAFSRSLGHFENFKRSGVRVVVICPGFTETKLTETIIPWDQTLKTELEVFMKSTLWQKVDAVGNAAVEIYQRAKSGSVWKIEGSQPIVEVTE